MQAEDNFGLQRDAGLPVLPDRTGSRLSIQFGRTSRWKNIPTMEIAQRSSGETVVNTVRNLGAPCVEVPDSSSHRAQTGSGPHSVQWVHGTSVLELSHPITIQFRTIVKGW